MHVVHPYKTRGTRMSINVKIPMIMRKETDWQGEVEMPCCTPEESLDELLKRFPAIKKWIYNKQDEMWDRLQFYVNGEQIHNHEMKRPMKDGDELFLLLNICGG